MSRLLKPKRTIAQLKDFSRPPSRMAELYVAASDTSRLAPKQPDGETVYHGTAHRYVGPPMPNYSQGGDGWLIKGVFVSNDPSAALGYMGLPANPYDDAYAARRMFKTRLDPSRIFVVEWTPDQLHRDIYTSQVAANERVNNEVRRFGLDRDKALRAFTQRYDAVMPPPFGHWDGIRGKSWQAIMFHPNFDGLLMPHPAIDDFDHIVPFTTDYLTTVDDALGEYAQAGGEGYDWARDIVELGQEFRPMTYTDTDYYQIHHPYLSFRDRSDHLGTIRRDSTTSSGFDMEKQIRDRRARLASTMSDIAAWRATLGTPDKRGSVQARLF